MLQVDREGERTVLMSVIVPVYNKEGSLESCIESLEAQTIDRSLMEVILVDDGSSDRSLELCKQAADQYSYIRVLSQENLGVSAARNAGIMQASGKYIMFLDADDSISKATTKNLVTCFDQVSTDVDVITYPLRYLNPQTGSKRPHKREEWLVEEGVYDLSEYPFIAQTTMNVCVKNSNDIVLFDQSMKMGEDQLFITENLKTKAAIGFCPRAEYVYVKDGSNSSRRGNNPLYAYDDMMQLYQAFLRVGKSYPRMREYCDHAILYNVDWRLRGNLLFPTFCMGEERVRQEERLAAVMRSVTAHAYCESPYLGEYHKSYLLLRYGFIDESSLITYTEDNTEVQLRDGGVWKTEKPKVVFSYCMKKGKTLCFRGRLVCPSFLLEDEPELYMRDSVVETRIELGPSSYDFNMAKVKTAKCYSFAFDMLVSKNAIPTSVEFIVKFASRVIPAVQLSFAPKRHNAQVVEGLLVFRDCVVEAVENSFVVGRRSIRNTFMTLLGNCVSNRAGIAKRIAVRLFMIRSRRRRVWLYSDLPTSSASGNALIQMLHDLGKCDGIERYYVSNHGEALIKEYPVLAEKILKCESREHVFNALKAEVVLVSYLENFTFRPVSQKTFDGLGDLTEPQEIIYLQHGILHAHMPWYFSYDRVLIDKVVVSTQFEIDNLTRNYYFPREALIPSGMPRFDSLEYDSKHKLKKILFAPSWRAYLVAGKASERVGIEDVFLSSSFYQGTKDFLDRIEKSGMLERYDYSLEVRLHPNFAFYEDLFLSDCARISLADSDINENDYEIMISDYSSYVYDFMYAGSKILNFISDYVEFKAGLSQYSELDVAFDDEQSFLCSSSEKAVASLEEIIIASEHDSGCHDVRDDFFLYSDGLNTERLYGSIISLVNQRRRC